MEEVEISSLVNRTTPCTVCDVLMRRGLAQFMNSRIEPLGAKRAAGPVLTVKRTASLRPAAPRASQASCSPKRSNMLNELCLAVFATGVLPAGVAGLLALGAINDPLVCGGLVVNHGDYA
jgi:regulator of RNase E activity RraA